MNPDTIALQGLAIWAKGLHSYSDLQEVVCTGALPGEAEFINPKPEAIPPRERRRAGLMINLAVTVAHLACEHAGVDKTIIPSVFASAMGDTDITDYMCRKLAQTEKLLSPTKFHNSVHNAPSGYWSISAENRAPSTFIGGYDNSFGAGLLEATSQVKATAAPVLLVAYDIANHAPFSDISSITESFACALVLSPLPPANGAPAELGITVNTVQAPASEPKTEYLTHMAKANPAAASLALLERVVEVQTAGGKQSTCLEPLIVPASPNMALRVDVTHPPSAGSADG
jgi:hypothetical protein